MTRSPDRVAAGRSSKRKGKTFEQEIVRLLKKAGLPAERNWHQSGAFAKAKKGKEKKPSLPDISIKGSPLWIECSSGARVSPVAKLGQALADIAGIEPSTERTPVVITRKKHQRAILVTMYVEDLCWLIDMSSNISSPIPLPVTFSFEDFLLLLEGTWLPSGGTRG